MTKFNRLAAFLFLVLCFSSLASAQEVTLTTKTGTIYLGANGAVFHDTPVVHTDIFLNWKNGVYADIWTSTAFKGGWGFDKEVDLTLGKSGKLGKFDYSTDVSYFALVITDIAVVNVEFSRTFQANTRIGLTPLVRGEYYFPVRKGGPRRGVMGIIGSRASVKLAPRVDFAGMARLRKDSGCFEFDSALLGQGFTGLNFKITEKLTLSSGIYFSSPISSVRDGRKKEAVPEIGISYRF